jgi:CzcA family heavy metal efflux pump
MRSIVESSLRFRGLVIGIAVALIVFGGVQLRNMPVDVTPEFVPPTVVVQTEALGLSAAEVEQLITVPLEADLLAGVPWLDRMESESIPGLSSVVLSFKQGTDLFRARQVVAERLTQAPGLPHVSKPPAMLQPLSSASRVMMVGLSSRDLSLIDMSVLARWTVRPRLMGVPGVANVSIWGQRERQLQVQVDPARLSEHGVSLIQVISTTGNALWVSPLSFLEASTPGTGGFIDTANQRLGIQHIFPIDSAEDLANVTIEPADPEAGPPPGALRLGDVATVVEDHQPLIGDAVVNDGDGLFLVVEKFPGANTLEVTNGVEEALAALRPGLNGVDIDTSVFRPATFIEQAMGNLGLAFLVAFILIALALGALLFDWRAGLVGLIAMPVSLLTSVIVLDALGATMNAMIVAGLVIAVAVVIDDAVVGTENVMRRLQESREGAERSMAARIVDACLEVRGALIYATLIIAVTLVPLLFVGIPAGAFLPSVGLAYLAAVASSMVVALTITPALSLILLSRWPDRRRESPLARRLQRGYEAMLGRIVQRPRAVVAATVILVMVGILVAPLMSASLIPTFKDRDLLIHWDGPAGTSREEMDRIVARASNELRALPGVGGVGGHVGRAVMSDQVVGTNSSELWVSIDPAADYDATVASVRQVVDGYPGLRTSLTTYPNERIAQVLSGSADDLAVRVYGEDLSVLRAKAEEVRHAVSRVDGVAAATVDAPVDQPTLEVQVDLAAAQQHGIKAGDVRRAAATLLSGLVVGSLFEDQKVFDVVVWGTPEVRHSLSSVEDLMIDTPTGGHVRLGDVAQVRIASYPDAIRREGVARRIDVGIDVRDRDLAAVARDVQLAIAQVPFPLEHHAELLAGYADRQAERDRMIAFGVFAAVIAFLLLQAAFGSWRLAILVFLTMPAALAGGLLVDFLTGGVLSLGSLGGLLTVLGLTARSGVLLIARYRRLQREEGEALGPELILRGGREQLVPTLTTAVATGLAVLPFVVLGDRAGLELVHPMALVILGGLVTSTLLTLVILPTLYLRLELSPKPDATTAQLVEQPGLSPA